MRFLAFLDHGFDEYGRADNNHGFFDARVLSETQLKELAKWVALHVDPHYRALIGSALRLMKTMRRHKSTARPMVKNNFRRNVFLSG